MQLRDWQIPKRPRFHSLVALTACALLWAGCSTQIPAGYVYAPPAPHRIYPRSHVVTASWYGPGFAGKRTSSGEIYNPNKFTAASTHYPLGSVVRVTNLSNGKSVIVRINDRGPYVPGRQIDLSKRAARAIGLERSGVGRVSVKRLDGP